METKDILKDLVKINTIQDKYNKEFIDYIENYLIQLGFKTESKTKNLVMSYGANYGLGFLGHSDTVEYIDGWKTNPHDLVEKDGILYGLGSSDMKGGIAAFLKAIKETDLNNLKRGIKVYITYDEEIGFKGIKEVVDNEVAYPEYMIFGEPTNNIECTACKGLLSFKLYTTGIKVHSSRTDRGKSANTSMIKLLNELEDYYNKEIKVKETNIYEVPYTTMNIGLLNGGSAINSVAASCYSYVDFRLSFKEHRDMLIKKVEELCSKYDGRYEIDDNILPFDNNVEFIKEKNSASFMTEASFIEQTKRIILGVGPVTAHEIDEHIEISSLEKLVDQYKEIITKTCN
ncbi:MAG: M20/M25/M40 family metallo-hydrolase [Bacilli bacterium]|nr:M20/M25/M40 family metallo-hydrolase [Bacilli bacterium]